MVSESLALLSFVSWTQFPISLVEPLRACCSFRAAEFHLTFNWDRYIISILITSLHLPMIIKMVLFGVNTVEKRKQLKESKVLVYKETQSILSQFFKIIIKKKTQS